jgi:hypothetical protein
LAQFYELNPISQGNFPTLEKNMKNFKLICGESQNSGEKKFKQIVRK